MTRLRISIDGMTCGHCTSRVEKALHALDGVELIEVSLEHEHAIVSLEQDTLAQQREPITDAIEFSGFDVLGLHALDGVEEEVGAASDERLVESTPSASTNVSEDGAPKSAQPEAPDESPLADEDGALDRVELDVRGMTCGSCVARVERALAGGEHVHSVQVNYATEVATVALTRGVSAEIAKSLADLVIEAGYEVEDTRWRSGDDKSVTSTSSSSSASTPRKDTASERREREAHEWSRRWIFGLLLLPAIVALQMGVMWFGWELSASVDMARLILLGYLSALVLGYSGKPFFQGAISSAKHGGVNMDTLVALGAGTAFTASLISLLLQGFGSAKSLGVHFEGAVMIVTLISVGKWLESRARGEASRALEALLEKSASSARVQRGEQWVEVAVSELERGDRFLVRAGEKIAVDGVIARGHAMIDESMLTGEPVPIKREVDDEVFGATINVDGELVVRATRVGGETTLARIAAEVERTQSIKAEIQKLADRISGVFVPVVLVIAMVTLAVWWGVTGDFARAIVPAVAVLVVACPCALGLATPTALMVGSSRAASRGILLRDPDALERARSVDAIIFDKTGTLTQGQMSVANIRAFAGEDRAAVLVLAARMERGSTHPIARAILEEASAQALDAPEVDDFESIAGDGVAASVDGTQHWLGKASWVLEQAGLSSDEGARGAVTEAEATGRTTIAIARKDALLGLIELEDQVKDSAREVVAALEGDGVQVWMITGDAMETAASVGEAVGISPERIMARVKPREKSAKVRELQEEGLTVAMIGDGINDAAALAAADLGISMGSGADVAIEAGDITLVSENLRAVLDALDIASATHGRIRQNLFWAFFYNVVLIPIAALGWLMPAMAAGAMALSSVSVVSNSLRPHRARRAAKTN